MGSPSITKVGDKSSSPSSKLCVTASIHRASQQFPQNICTIDAVTGREKNYKQTKERVSRFAAALKSSGLSKEGRVALVMLNSDRYFER